MLIKEFVEIYEYLMIHFNSNPVFSLKKTKQNYAMIENFLNTSNIQTPSQLWRYLLFQFVLNESRRSNKYSAMISNCVSKNALKRWEERTEEQIFLMAKFQREKGLSNPLAREEYSYSEEFKDMTRKKYWNTPRGYILCNEYDGALYDRVKCFRCKYKEACKHINE